MRRAVVTWVIALTAVWCAMPATALADPVNYTRTTSFSGADAVRVALGSLRHVELGSRVSTVTLELEGRRVPITVGYADLLRGASPGSVPVVPVALAVLGLDQMLRILGRLRRTVRG